MWRSLLPWRSGASRSGRWDDSLHALQREIHHVFDRLAEVRGTTGGDLEGVLEPEIDVSETNHDLQVSVELPGVDEKDIDISLVGDVLTIKGEKRAEKEEKRRHYHVVERSYGAFERRIELPAKVDPDKVAASFAKGVLTVTLPEAPEEKAKRKKIEVKGH